MIKDIEAGEYRKNRKYISPSDVKGCKTPLEFLTKFNAPPLGRKEAFEVGSATHTFILEPDEFKKSVIVIQKEHFPEPEKVNLDGSINLRIAANKRHYDKVLDMNPKKNVITFDQFEMIQRMAKSIHSLNGIDEVLDLNNAIIEHSFYARIVWTKAGIFEKIIPADDNEENDALSVLVKTRPDYIHNTKLYDLDLKTCQSVDPRDFGQDAVKYEYDIQAAMGLDIVSANMPRNYETFLFLAVSKNPPYDAILYDLFSDDIMSAKAEYLFRLNMIRQARNSGFYKGFEVYSANDYPMLTLKLPKYRADSFNHIN